MIKVRQIKIDAKEKNILLIRKKVCKRLNINDDEILEFNIVKESIDARKIPVFFTYEVNVKLKNESGIKFDNDVCLTEEESYHFETTGEEELSTRPIIVGDGPSGLFAAYMLSEAGFNPLVIERGSDITNRVKKVEDFWNTGVLDVNTNVCFGEGGAGTFSDGKLNTLNKDINHRIRKVFEIFVENGAPEDILYKNKPHIGTDILRDVIVNMRKKIESFGGEFLFNKTLTDIDVKDGRIVGIYLGEEYLKCDLLILAIGHSAKDTFEMLNKKGLIMENKPFAVGIRIIHKQELINEKEYGSYASYLDNASYKLTYNKDDKGIYSFCMCPGGYVVDSSSELEHLCINGMSNRNRDSGYANSAIVVTVNSKDYGDNLFDGLKYQEKLEEKAYKLCNGKIPVETLKDYIDNKKGSSFDKFEPIFKGRYEFANINEIFDEETNALIKESINNFDTKIKGFSGDAVVAGVESRTSSPVRIVRDYNMESNIKGIYPIGEGSGYSGGITTSSVDGVKVSEVIRTKFKSFQI